MAHLPGGFAALSDGIQFVVFPKGAVEDCQVTLLDTTKPMIPCSGQIGSVEKFLFLRDKCQADDGLFRRKASSQRFSYIIRETPVKRNGFAEEAAFLVRQRRRNERNQAIE